MMEVSDNEFYTVTGKFSVDTVSCEGDLVGRCLWILWARRWTEPKGSSAKIPLKHSTGSRADPSGRMVVYVICLWPLTCWDRGFETPQGHVGLLLVSVMICLVERSLHRDDHSPQRVLMNVVCLSVIVKPRRGGPGPQGCVAQWGGLQTFKTDCIKQ